MTVKEFFKSNVLKCIVTLLCVLLVSGVFLTVMNGLLEVTAEEKFNRAINKIYGKSVSAEAVAVADYNSNATIEEAYKIKDDGNYLVKSTGKGGFDNGTVTCWVVVEVKNGALGGIGKVVIDSNKAQSYIANISDSFLSQFSANFDGNPYNPNEGFIKTGATRSANAICNAVNGAMDFVNAKFGNVKTEGEKFLESIQKIYGETEIKVYGTDAEGNDALITNQSESVKGYLAAPVTSGSATVSEIYKVTYADGEKTVLHYLVTSTGTGGYDRGTVTCYVAVAVEDNKPTTIYNVSIKEEYKQSYIDKIKHLDNFKNADATGATVFAPTGDYLSTGATMSSTAIVNAVNGAITYLNGAELSAPVAGEGGETEEGGAANE